MNKAARFYQNALLIGTFSKQQHYDKIDAMPYNKGITHFNEKQTNEKCETNKAKKMYNKISKKSLIVSSK